jgi:hypothetical protein
VMSVRDRHRYTAKAANAAARTSIMRILRMFTVSPAFHKLVLIFNKIVD